MSAVDKSAKVPGYWFKVPAELDALMELGINELKVFLVLTRAIQQDRNRGLLAIREIKRRIHSKGMSHVQEAINALCDAGWFTRHDRYTGEKLTDPKQWKAKMVEYRQTIQWARKDTSNCTPEGYSLDSAAKPNCTPEGNTLALTLALKGVQHLEEEEEEGTALVSSASLNEIETVSSSSALDGPELVKGGAETDVSDDDEPPFFSEKEKAKTRDSVVTMLTGSPKDLATLVETARQQLRMARAEGLDVPVEQVKVPDRAITTRILGLFTELVDFETWLAGTLRTGLARKARDSRWGLYETDAFNHWADILQQRRTAEQRAADEAVEAEQQRAAEAAELVVLDTPMLALQAFGLIQRALNGSGVPKPLKAKLERTSELISPNDLKAAIRNWKRCPQCEDGGTVGHAFYGTLAFCTCLAGLEAGYDKGTDWPAEEIARVHSSTKNKLVAAARTRGAHLADAIEASTITETPSKLVFHAPKSYLLYFKDKGFTEVLKLAGEQRTWVVEMATEAVA